MARSFYAVHPPIWNDPNSPAPDENADDWLDRLLRAARAA